MATILITKQEASAYLGRSLTSIEDTNFNTYAELAQKRLLGVLCLEGYPETLDSELKLLIAQMFGVISQDLKATVNSNVESKRVEDVEITYETNPDSPEVIFEKTFAKEIALYSKCKSTIRSGEVIYGDCFRCI